MPARGNAGLACQDTLAQELRDARLHCTAHAAARFPAKGIIRMLDDSGISHAAISSQPPALVERLVAAVPQCSAPLPGVHREPDDGQRRMYYPAHHGRHFGGILEKVMHEFRMFDRNGALAPSGFEGTGGRLARALPAMGKTASAAA